jgi:hypothetical protein
LVGGIGIARIDGAEQLGDVGHGGIRFKRIARIRQRKRAASVVRMK